MAEILRTYDHCRLLFYMYDRRQNIGSGPLSKEFLVDCYYRLFSMLDKIAKVLSSLLSLDDMEDNSFSAVCERLIPSDDYLGGIYRVYKELFYTMDELKSGVVDEFNSVHQVKMRANMIRNMIAHSALYFIDSDDDYVRFDNVLTLSESDLELETANLLDQIREILLNLQFAINTGEIDQYRR